MNIRQKNPLIILAYTCCSSLIIYLILPLLQGPMNRSKDSLVLFKWLPCFLITAQCVFLLVLVFKGLSRYKENARKVKWRYVGAVLTSYLVIAFSTIFIFAKLYDRNFEEYYLYAEAVREATETFPEISIETSRDEIIVEGDGEEVDLQGRDIFYLDKVKKSTADTVTVVYNADLFKAVKIFHGSRVTLLEARYDPDITAREPMPYTIDVTDYRQNGDFIRSYKLAPTINIDAYGMNLVHPYPSHLYLSTVTYLGGGYGDVYPTSDLIKTFAVQEMFISHIMGLLIVPLLLAIIQVFVGEAKD